MLSLNWQRTFDGATPRISRPTLASGEHGAPVQGLGPGSERRVLPTQITVQGLGLVAKGEFCPHKLPSRGWGLVAKGEFCLHKLPSRRSGAHVTSADGSQGGVGGAGRVGVPPGARYSFARSRAFRGPGGFAHDQASGYFVVAAGLSPIFRVGTQSRHRRTR
jgi:hypothetical protein